MLFHLGEALGVGDFFLLVFCRGLGLFVFLWFVGVVCLFVF